MPPLGTREDPGYAVDGNDALVGLVVAIDCEGDAFGGEGVRYALLDRAEFFGGKPLRAASFRGHHRRLGGAGVELGEFSAAVVVD